MGTKAENFKIFEEQNGYKHPDHEALEEFKLPKGMELSWDYFIQLSNARSSNGYGANPISYTDIAAWNELTETQVTPLEVKIIKQLDIIYLNHQAVEQGKRNKGK